MGRPKKPAAEQKVRIGVSLSPRVLRMLDWLALPDEATRSKRVENLTFNEVVGYRGVSKDDPRFDPPKEKK